VFLNQFSAERKDSATSFRPLSQYIAQHLSIKLDQNKLYGTMEIFCYNRETVITERKEATWDQKGEVKFVHYSREFVITVFVIN
jgi:hypothetical protein